MERLQCGSLSGFCRKTPYMLDVDFDVHVDVFLDVDTAMMEQDLPNASMFISERLVHVHVEVQVHVHDDKAVFRFGE